MRTEPWIALPVLAAEELWKRSIHRRGNVGGSLPRPPLILAGASVVSCTSRPAKGFVAPLLHKLLGLLPIRIDRTRLCKVEAGQSPGWVCFKVCRETVHVRIPIHLGSREVWLLAAQQLF